MTLKTLAAAATLAVFATTGVKAATFDFSFDTSTATTGDTSLTAVGTFDINVAPGSDFSSLDISNVSIVIDSDLFDPFTVNTSLVTDGSLSSDGTVATFSDLFFTMDTFGSPATGNFGCPDIACSTGKVFSRYVPSSGFADFFDLTVSFSDPDAALTSFKATAQVSAVPLPAGSLLLLSGIGGVAALKRRKKRAA